MNISGIQTHPIFLEMQIGIPESNEWACGYGFRDND
jgi:hypothetical protein